MALSFDQIIEVMKYTGKHTHDGKGQLTDTARAVANECKDKYLEHAGLVPILNEAWERRTPECEFFEEETPVCDVCASSPKGLLDKAAHVTLTDDPPTNKPPRSFT